MARRADSDDFNGIRDEVIRLRCEGHSYQYIATAVGISEARATKIVREEFREALGDRQELIGDAKIQYDYLYTKILEQFRQRNFADAALGKLVLQILADRRRLLGIDAPSQVQVTHSIDELSLEEVNQRLAQYEAIPDAQFAVRQLPAAGPAPTPTAPSAAPAECDSPTTS